MPFWDNSPPVLTALRNSLRAQRTPACALDCLRVVASRSLATFSFLTAFSFGAQAQPVIALTHSQALVDDVNSDGAANPGDTVGYTVTVTNTGNTAAANVVVSVALDSNTALIPGSFNLHPVAIADPLNITEDAVPNTVGGNVLVNDSGADTGETLVVTALGGSSTPGTVSGSFGTLSWAADGTVLYTLNNTLAQVSALNVGQTLAETFNYTVGDGSGFTDTAALTVTIAGVNDPPVTNGDTYQSFNNFQAVVDTAHGLLANDTDAEGQTLTISTADTASALGGTVAVNTDGSFTYTPANLNTGQTDSFNYTARDASGATTAGTATLAGIGRILFVNNTNVSGTGTFADPFQSLSTACSSNFPNDTVFVYRGTGTNDSYDQTYNIVSDNVSIIGEKAGLILNGTVQIAPGLAPVIGTNPMNAQHVSFLVNNKNFSLSGISFQGDGQLFSGALRMAFDDGNPHLVVVKDTFVTNTEVGFELDLSSTSAVTATFVAVQANGNGIAGILAGLLNTSTINFTALNSQFVDNGVGITLNGDNASAIAANIGDTLFRTPISNSAGFFIGTDNNAQATATFVGGNQVNSNASGITSFTNSTIAPILNILTDNVVTTNAVGVCNDRNRSTITINPPSQVSGNTTDIDVGMCGG